MTYQPACRACRNFEQNRLDLCNHRPIAVTKTGLGLVKGPMSGRFSVNAQTTDEGTTLAHASERRVGLRPAARSGSHPQPAAELLEAVANADKRGVLRETVVERGSNAPSLLVHRVPCRGEGRQPQPRADRRPSRPGDTAPRCRAVPEPRLGAEPVGELLHAPEVVDVTVRVSLYRPTAMVPSGPPSISTSRHAPRPGATREHVLDLRRRSRLRDRAMVALADAERRHRRVDTDFVVATRTHHGRDHAHAQRHMPPMANASESGRQHACVGLNDLVLVSEPELA